MGAWGRDLCSSALNCVLPIDNHIFATGDDGGAVKVWDLRRGSAILEARQQEEYISAMTVDGNGKILLTAWYQRDFMVSGSGSPCPRVAGGSALCHVLCSQRVPSTSHSGDGTLGVFNVKRRRFELVSEPQNGDLTSVVLMKVGTAPRHAWPRPRSEFFVLPLPHCPPSCLEGEEGGVWLQRRYHLPLQLGRLRGCQ